MFRGYDLEPDLAPACKIDDSTLDLCSELVHAVTELLSALLPKMHATDPTSQSNGSSRSGTGSCRHEGRRGDHSQTAAATRAARVLQERRLAQRVLFPKDLLSLLASVMQVLNALFSFFENHNCNEAGLSHCRPQRTATIAHSLFQDGQLVQSLHLVSSYMLRCARRRQPSSSQQPLVAEESPSFEQVQRAACQSVCDAACSMSVAIMAMNYPEIAKVMDSIPAQFFDTLGCLACEALPSDDSRAWAVGMLAKDAYLSELNGDGTFSLTYRPAMQVLMRRGLTYGISLRAS